jgi:hypothetical protein
MATVKELEALLERLEARVLRLERAVGELAYLQYSPQFVGDGPVHLRRRGLPALAELYELARERERELPEVRR